RRRVALPESERKSGPTPFPDPRDSPRFTAGGIPNHDLAFARAHGAEEDRPIGRRPSHETPVEEDLDSGNVGRKGNLTVSDGRRGARDAGVELQEQLAHPELVGFSLASDQERDHGAATLRHPDGPFFG